MILGKMKQCGAQANAARCNGLRSALRLLHLPSAALVASVTPRPSTPPAASVHSPLSGQEAASRKSGRGSRGKGIASQDSTEAHRPGMPTDLGRRRKEYHPFSPSMHPRSPGSMHRPLQKAARKQQAACIVPCKKPQESNRQNDWPVEAFWACFRFTMAHFRQLGEKSRARGL